MSSTNRISGSGSSSSSLNNPHSKDDVPPENNEPVGRIWIHRPFQKVTPSSSISSSSASSSGPIIINCPLPQKTPPSLSENKLHNLAAAAAAADASQSKHSSSSSSSSIQNNNNMFLKQINKSKYEFYQSQFQSWSNTKGEEEVHKRIVRRRIQRLGKSNNHDNNNSGGLHDQEVGVTIYFPEGLENHNNNYGVDDKTTKSKLLQGICLHVHGGGWLWGDSYYQVAHRCLEMAQMLNVAVVSVEYSLLGQDEQDHQQQDHHQQQEQQQQQQRNAFNPVIDVVTAMEWIETHGPKELHAHSNLIASGESSGAHLLVLAMLLRQQQRTKQPQDGTYIIEEQEEVKVEKESVQTCSLWKCLNLVYGVYDLSGTPSIRSDGETSSPLCGNDLLWMYDLYCSSVAAADVENNNNTATTIDARKDMQHPLVSPLYANLSHLPPALLTVGTADPLFDDTIFMATKYSSYGNHVELAIYEGGEHGIGHFGMQEEDDMGKRARRHTLEFLKRHLDDLEEIR